MSRPVGRIFDATTAARISWGRAGMPSGLSGWFDDLLRHVSGTVRADGTTWLLEQYTALRQIPERIRRLQSLAQATSEKVGLSGAGNSTDDVAKLLQAAQSLVGVQAGYPSMIASVDDAYHAIQSATADTVSLALAGTVASAVYQARAAMSQVDDAEASIRSAIDHLIQTGVITERDAQTLAAGSAGGISSALLWIGGTIGALWLARKFLR